MIVAPFGFMGGGVEAEPLALPESTVFDLDATDANSYSGSGQVWANLEATPADGELQTAYDLQFGNSDSPGTDDPTFTGTAGDPDAYMLFDGGDKFRPDNLTNTQFLKDLHKTTGGTDWWMACAIDTTNFSTNSGIFGTRSNSTSNIGVLIGFDTTAHVRVRQNGISGAPEIIHTTTGAMSDNPPGNFSLIVVTYENSTDTLRIYLDSVTADVDVTAGWESGSTDASDLYAVGASGGGIEPLKNGGKMAAISMGNSFLSPSEVQQIFDVYGQRHNRNYEQI